MWLSNAFLMADRSTLWASTYLVDLVANDQSLVAAADLAHFIVVVAYPACLQVVLQIVVQVLQEAMQLLWLADQVKR